MPAQSDTKRHRSVDAEFDQNFSATPLAGIALAEQTMRSAGIWRMIKQHLPPRNTGAQYTTQQGVYALLMGLLAGGKGIQATEFLRQDPQALEIAGLEKAPSDSTLYRILCDLAGLDERKQSECYEPSGPTSPSLDMLGREVDAPVLKRTIPETPEAASPEQKERLDDFVAAMARSCLPRMNRNLLYTNDFLTVFFDGTDLEVDGACFDAARVGRDGVKHLRWLTGSIGPILSAQELCEGNSDEGVNMPRLIDAARKVAKKILRPNEKPLALMDAAYFENQVVSKIQEAGWHFIVGANQQRGILVRLAEAQNEAFWESHGPDVARGWSESQTISFTHLPEGWAAPINIICRRYQKDDEIDGVWHHAFVATRLEEKDLPKKLLPHGYCQAIWMLYGTKQGRENHYKTPLRDFGLHHPPSCRLGVNQVFYAVTAAATNIAMLMRYRVIPQPDRGLQFWRLRERYFRIAGYLKRAARRLTVYLAGGTVDLHRQALFRRAMAEAARL